MIPRVLKWDKAKIDDRVAHLLKIVKLDPETYSDRYPAELSGGQQKRVGKWPAPWPQTRTSS